MIIAFRKPAFLHALESVAKVCPTTKTVPILNHFRLDAEDGQLHLTGTDLITTIVVALGGLSVLVKQPGSVLLDAQEFLAYVREGSGDTLVRLVSDDNGATSYIGTNSTTWKAPPVSQFPDIVHLADKHTHVLRRADLVRALRLVKTAAATSFNPKLEQVGIRAGVVQAADGIRFHQVALADSDQMDLTLPLPFLDDVVTLLGSSGEPTVTMGVPEDGGSVIVRDGDMVLMSARKKEPLPDLAYTFLVPAMTHDITLRVPREPLIAAVRRVRVQSDPIHMAIRLILTDNLSVLEVRSQRQTGAWASEKVPAEWAGGQRTLVVNHHYLLHLLHLFTEDMLTLRLGPDAKHKPSPLLIQEEGRTGVLMQLRLDWT